MPIAEARELAAFCLSSDVFACRRETNNGPFFAMKAAGLLPVILLMVVMMSITIVAISGAAVASPRSAVQTFAAETCATKLEMPVVIEARFAAIERAILGGGVVVVSVIFFLYPVGLFRKFSMEPSKSHESSVFKLLS